jgi:uncharacterized protein YkwD
MKLEIALFSTVIAALIVGCGSSDSESLNSANGGKGGGGTGASGGAAGSSAGGTAGAASGGDGGGETGGGASGAGGAPGGGGGSNTGGCPGFTGACGDDGTGWPANAQDFECKLIDLLNQKRSQGVTCGSTVVQPVPEVSRNQILTDNARAHAKNMNDQSYVDLVEPDGTGPIDWSMPGYCGTYVTAEVGGGQADPGTFLSTLLNVETECKKLMIKGAKGVGVGYYTDPTGTSVHLWTLVLGSAP